MSNNSTALNGENQTLLSSIMHGVIRRRCALSFRKPAAKCRRLRHSRRHEPRLTEADYMILEDFQQRLWSLGFTDDFVQAIRQSNNPTESFIRYLGQFERILERADRGGRPSSSLSSHNEIVRNTAQCPKSSSIIALSVTDDLEEEKDVFLLGTNWGVIDVDNLTAQYDAICRHINENPRGEFFVSYPRTTPGRIGNLENI